MSNTSNSKNCLLIVNVQNGFVNDLTKHIPSLVEAEQLNHDYVVATRFYNLEKSLFRTLLNWNNFAIDSDDYPLAFNVKDDAWIINTSVYTCVFDGFIKWLRDRNISLVHVCGIGTDISVSKCAVDLFEYGIEPVILSKLCASYTSHDAHDNALITLERYIGKSQIR